MTFGDMTLVAMTTFSKSILATYVRNLKQMGSLVSSIPSAVWGTLCARNNVHSIALHVTLHVNPCLDIDHFRHCSLYPSSARHNQLTETGPQTGCEQIGGSSPETRLASPSS